MNKYLGALCGLAMLAPLNAAFGQDVGIQPPKTNYFGLEGGVGFSDVKAKETAQALANLIGSSVSYSYNKAFFTGRAFVGFGVTDSISAELGVFGATGLEATYSITGASATEKYSANGFDLVGVYSVADSGLFLKAGMHSSKLDGKASVTLNGTSYNIGSQSASGTGLVYGLGFSTPLEDGASIRYGYTHYSEIGGIKGADIDNVSIAYVMPF